MNTKFDQMHQPRRRRFRRVAWMGIIAAGMTVFTIAFASGCSKGESTAADAGKEEKAGEGKGAAHAQEVTLSEDAIKQFNVKVDKVARRTLSPTLAVPARVSYNSETLSHVGVPVAGRVVELKVRLGDVVKKDDVLMVVDSPELGEAQSDYLQKRTTLTVAGPAVELAKSSFERSQQLFKESEGIALSEVQKRQGELQTAQGALKTAEGAVIAAENKLKLLGMTTDRVTELAKTGQIDTKYQVRAAIAGQVVEREVTLGELVHPEKESLLVLVDLTTLWVIADVPQAQVQAIAVGNNARILPTSSSASAIEGKVAYIPPQVDPSTRTAQVRVEVKSDHTNLRAGMFVEAEVELSTTTTTKASQLAIPDDAVQTVDGAPSVFVPVNGEANKFVKHNIAVGEPVGGWLPVVSGLKEGEAVVVSGSFILKAELGKSSAEED
jgi:RND family efflux transporter MFP subunit